MVLLKFTHMELSIAITFSIFGFFHNFKRELVKLHFFSLSQTPKKVVLNVRI